MLHYVPCETMPLDGGKSTGPEHPISPEHISRFRALYPPPVGLVLDWVDSDAESLRKKAKNLGQQWRKGRFVISEGPVFLRPDPGCAQC